MFWDIFNDLLFFLAGIGVFLVGIVKFSNLLQSEASDSVKNVFKRMGDNRLVGFGVGAGTTTVVQSSTATTIIVVSLVNAGIMTAAQSTAVIFGANVGTALSNMLLSLSSFRIRYVFMLFVFIGALTKLFTQKPRINRIADFLMSFGIIFVGLEIMRLSFENSVYLVDGFSYLLSTFSNPLMLILLAFTLTAIIQSSTAATAIFISLATVEGLLEFSTIMYLVMGSLLGTTVTTLIAAIPANRNAKRAAVMHLMFNVFAVLIFLPIVWPLENNFVWLFNSITHNAIWQITLFSLMLKLATATILLCFIKQVNLLVHFIVRDKPEAIVKDDSEALDISGFTDKF